MYKVNNIDRSDWKEYKYMVIRDCVDDLEEYYNGDEKFRYWYWGSYDDLGVAHNEASELCNGLLVETENVVKL